MSIESSAARGDVGLISSVLFSGNSGSYHEASGLEFYDTTFYSSVTVDLTPKKYDSSSTFEFELGHTYRFSFTTQYEDHTIPLGITFYHSVLPRDLTLSIGDTTYNLGNPSNGSEKSFDWVCDTNTASFLAQWRTECTAHLQKGDKVRFYCWIYFNDVVIEDVSPRSEKEILEDINKDTTETLEQAKEQTETQKGIFASIKEFFAGFFQNLIDSVIGLFVPSSDEMSDLFGQLNDFFSDTFGFLYAPFDYLIQLVGVFTSSTGTTGLTFPGFSIMGYEVWPDMTYDIASDPVAGKVLGYVRTGTGILLAGWFIMYLQDFFKERFGSGDG